MSERGAQHPQEVLVRFMIMKALGWYLKNTRMAGNKKVVIASRLGYSKSRISQWTISKDEDVYPEDIESWLKSKNKSLIPMDIAEKICSCLNTTIFNILAIYFLSGGKPLSFSNMTEVEKLKFLEGFMGWRNEAKLPSLGTNTNLHFPSVEPSNNSIIWNISDDKFRPWAGKLYCYFYSTNSREIGKMQREGGSAPNFGQVITASDEVEDLYRELLKLSSGDGVHCGIMQVDSLNDSKDGMCHVSLSFIPNITHGNRQEKVYRGILTFSSKTSAVFFELIGEGLGDKTFLITDNPDFSTTNTKVSCCIAMVLTYSSGVNHRRPCCERMVITRTPIIPGTSEYEEMLVQLRMNEKFIRIDEVGYSHLLGSISGFPNKDIEAVKEAFPSFDSLSNTQENVVRVLHINEDDINRITTGLNMQQKKVFLRLLRKHSLAPFYCKTKATKAEDILFEMQRENSDADIDM